MASAVGRAGRVTAVPAYPGGPAGGFCAMASTSKGCFQGNHNHVKVCKGHVIHDQMNDNHRFLISKRIWGSFSG